MNALKNILFFGLLFAVLCGVYFSLSRQPEQPLPAGLDPNVKAPIVEIPGLNSPVAGSANPPAASSPSLANTPSKASPWPSTGDVAPPFAPKPGGAADQVAVGPPPRENAVTATPPGLSADQTMMAPPLGSLPPPPDTRSERNYPAGVKDPFGRDNAAAGRYAAAPPAPPTTQVGLHEPEEHARPSSIENIRQQVALKVQENKLADALLLLTPLQDNPDVPPNEARQITEILDYMAAKVIYSREHLLERPYGVQPGDTLDSIAQHYQVPALLLSRINGVDSQNVRPGKELKVLNGPFSAYVSTERSELKMMLNGSYAGRFRSALSSDLQNVKGMYRVVDKSKTEANGSPSKPQWIELVQGNSSTKIGIEAAADLSSAAAAKPCTIWLSKQDMDDVYGILSVGSVVIIQR
jgi:LysM repeat protein